MRYEELENSVIKWTEWASKTEESYDIALFKVWIQMELFIRDIFIDYCLGNASEKGFTPALKIAFVDEIQLNAFLRDGSKKYVEYQDKIEKLSVYIFEIDPFDILKSDANYKPVISQIKSLRNYIAHESGESKSKFIRQCLGGNDANFVSTNDFLTKKERQTGNSYFSYYNQMILEIAFLLIDPIID